MYKCVYRIDNYPTKKRAAASSMVQVTVLPSSEIITSWPHHPLLIRQSAQDRGRVMAISAGCRGRSTDTAQPQHCNLVTINLSHSAPLAAAARH